MRLVAEVQQHAVAVARGPCCHVVEEDRGQAGVEGAVHEAEGEEGGGEGAVRGLAWRGRGGFGFWVVLVPAYAGGVAGGGFVDCAGEEGVEDLADRVC